MFIIFSPKSSRQILNLVWPPTDVLAEVENNIWGSMGWVFGREPRATSDQRARAGFKNTEFERIRL
jgi:hypothetical protein